MPYFYAALNDPSRLPQKGGLRLAPVTLISRIEMLPLAEYGISGYHVYAWHDVSIPTYMVGSPPYFISESGSYYPIYAILMMVAKGVYADIPSTSYIILRKEVVSTSCYGLYNLVYSGLNHVVVMPPAG